MPELYCQHCGIKLSPDTRNTRCPKNKDGFHHFQSKEKPIIKDIDYDEERGDYSEEEDEIMDGMAEGYMISEGVEGDYKDGFHHFQSKEKPIIKDINYNQQDISAPDDYDNISEWKKVEASIPELSEAEKDEDSGIKKNSKNYKFGENSKEYEDDSEDEDEISED